MGGGAELHPACQQTAEDALEQVSLHRDEIKLGEVGEEGRMGQQAGAGLLVQLLALTLGQEEKCPEETSSRQLLNGKVGHTSDQWGVETRE